MTGRCRSRSRLATASASPTRFLLSPRFYTHQAIVAALKIGASLDLIEEVAMEETLMESDLGNVLTNVKQIMDRDDGVVALYISETRDEEALSDNTYCVVIYVSEDNDTSDISQFATQNQLKVMLDLWLAKDIVRQTRINYPNASGGRLVQAVIYYLSNDAYFP